MFIRTRKYRYDAGGGSNTGASSVNGTSIGPAPSTEIKIDVKKYNKTVKNIEEQKDEIIKTDSGYVEIDKDCTLNDVIPKYKEADEAVEDMLRLMKKEMEHIVEVMTLIRADYEKVDSEKSQEAARNFGDN